MKNIFIFLLLLTSFISCGGDDPIPKEYEVLVPNQLTEEDVYKETGCRPRDADKIKMCSLFEVGGYKYLYGSKEINNKESLWVSKYDQQGDCIW
jgi:hypothetical protein